MRYLYLYCIAKRPHVYLDAGQTFGDSLSPVLGAVLYDLCGISAAYLSQTAIFLMALAALLLLGVCWKAKPNQQPQPQQQLLPSTTSTALPCSKGKREGLKAEHCCSCRPASAFKLTGSAYKQLLMQPDDNDDYDVHVKPCDYCLDHAASAPPDVTTFGLGLHSPSPSLEVPWTAAFLRHAKSAGTLLKARKPSSLVVDLHTLPYTTTTTRDGSSTPTWGEAPCANIKSTSKCTDESSEAGVTTATLAPWQLLKHVYVLMECGVLFLAQMLRAVLDALVPLAMYETSTWLVGMVYLGGACGAVLAPFVLDQLLEKAGRLKTHVLELYTVTAMSFLGCAVLLVNMSVPGALVLSLAFCAMHSMTEALAFKHVLDYVGSDESALLTATMSLFSLFYVLGFTVGALIAGAPSPVVVVQQQLAAAAVAGANLLYSILLYMLIKKGHVQVQK